MDEKTVDRLVKATAGMTGAFLVVMLVATAIIAGCGADPERTTATRGSADIIGTITEVTPGGEGIGGTFQVEVTKTDAPSDKYVISVGDDAPVYRRVGDEQDQLEEVGFTALQAGSRVEVWITGPVAESFPMQARAEFVVIAGAAER